MVGRAAFESHKGRMGRGQLRAGILLFDAIDAYQVQLLWLEPQAHQPWF